MRQAGSRPCIGSARARRALLATVLAAGALPVMLAGQVAAAPGDPDSNFFAGGLAIMELGPEPAEITDLAVSPFRLLPPGAAANAYVAGSLDKGGTRGLDFMVARQVLGIPQPSFGVNSVVTTDFGNTDEAAAAVGVMADGMLVVAGTRDSGGAAGLDFAVARYTPAGALDLLFDGDGRTVTDFSNAPTTATALALQPDGKVLVAGDGDGAAEGFVVARYGLDGALDPTFDGDGRVVTDIGPFDDGASAITLQPDGRIVVAGFTGTGGADADFAVVRYRTDGTLDTTFAGDGSVTTPVGTADDAATAVAVSPNGTIVAAGYSTAPTEGFAAVRFRADGALDPTFGTGGKVITDLGADDTAGDVVVQADGKVIVSGRTGIPSRVALVRYRANGALDPAFSGDGSVVTPLTAGDGLGAMAVQDLDGRLLVAGQRPPGGTGAALVRYDSDPGLQVLDGILRGPTKYAEGGLGKFEVILSSSPIETATVKYATTGGTATPGVDFQPMSGTLTFLPGQTVKTIEVPLFDDDLAETEPLGVVTETVALAFSDPVNLSLVRPSGLFQIVDNVSGYRLIASDGGVFSFGRPYLGSTGNVRLNKPIVGGAATRDGKGYWLVASDGGVFAFGSARFYGSTGNIRLNRPIVGMAATASGDGYWLVASDGGVFAFGNAPFLGSTGNVRLNRPIVGMAETNVGTEGYFLVASDGGVFAFGSAEFRGSTGSLHLNQPIVGMATHTATVSDRGYWLVASDGGVFAFGTSEFRGSMGGTRLAKPIVGITALSDRQGYWLVASDGGVFAFGDLTFRGSMGGTRLAQPIVGIA